MATSEDRDLEARQADDRKKVFTTCQELIAKRRLQMDLVDLEIIQGRERVIFYYLAEFIEQVWPRHGREVAAIESARGVDGRPDAGRSRRRASSAAPAR